MTGTSRFGELLSQQQELPEGWCQYRPAPRPSSAAQAAILIRLPLRITSARGARTPNPSVTSCFCPGRSPSPTSPVRSGTGEASPAQPAPPPLVLAAQEPRQARPGPAFPRQRQPVLPP